MSGSGKKVQIHNPSMVGTVPTYIGTVPTYFYSRNGGVQDPYIEVYVLLAGVEEGAEVRSR